jgi:hypothetical protein
MRKYYSVTKSLKSFPGFAVREGMKREDTGEREEVEDHESKGRATRK